MQGAYLVLFHRSAGLPVPIGDLVGPDQGKRRMVLQKGLQTGGLGSKKK